MFGKSKSKASGQKKRPTLDEIQKSSPEQNLSDLEQDVSHRVASLESGANGFFCTDEQFITKLDDRETLKYIRAVLPDFSPAAGAAKFKQAVISFFEDENFVRDVMREFDFSPHDLFKFVFRLDPPAFKGMFMKKVKEIVAAKRYSSARR